MSIGDGGCHQRSPSRDFARWRGDGDYSATVGFCGSLLRSPLNPPLCLGYGKIRLKAPVSPERKFRKLPGPILTPSCRLFTWLVGFGTWIRRGLGGQMGECLVSFRLEKQENSIAVVSVPIRLVFPKITGVLPTKPNLVTGPTMQTQNFLVANYCRRRTRRLWRRKSALSVRDSTAD